MSRTIWVDADACPVKQEIADLAVPLQIPVMMISSYDHAQQQRSGVTQIHVDMSDQSADLYISNRIKPHDILVTQDYGLAAIGLGKRAIALSFRGQLFSDDTIDFLLARRHEHAKMRRNGKYSKGPKRWSKEDTQLFLRTMTKVLHSLQEYK